MVRLDEASIESLRHYLHGELCGVAAAESQYINLLLGVGRYGYALT